MAFYFATFAENYFKNMTQNVQLSVKLTPKLRLKRALKKAGIEDPASVIHLAISGALTKSDFLYINEKMAKTLQSLDLSNASSDDNTFEKEHFSNCAALTSIVIPDSGGKYEVRDLSFLPALTHIAATPENPDYTSEDGVLFNKIKSALVRYPAGRQGDYVIPRSVVKIEDNAFANCTGLSAVTIPDSVVKIGRWAFMNCNGLKSLIIPDSVIVIDDDAFGGCNGLTSINIPKSVVKLETQGSPCLSLTDITVHPDNPMHTDENGVLFNKNKTVLVRYPEGRQGDYVIPCSVVIIESNAFADCTGLSAVTIPDSVIEIGYRAFAGCTGLTAIAFPNSLRIIDSYAFERCAGLSDVKIPDTVMRVGYGAFEEKEEEVLNENPL